MPCPVCRQEPLQMCRLAVAEFREQFDQLQGIVWFAEFKGRQGLLVYGEVAGIPAGEHGFHVHQYGNLRNLQGQSSCMECGGHWNPTNCEHGGLNQSNSHAGDLGNIRSTGPTHDTIIKLWANKLTLTGPNSIAGRSIVIHADPDDLGKGSNPESKVTGNSGSRIGCAVIGLSEVPKDRKWSDSDVQSIYNSSYGGGGPIGYLKERKTKKEKERKKKKEKEEKEEKEKEQRQEFAQKYLNENLVDNWADEFTEESLNQLFRNNLWKDYISAQKYDLTYLKYDDAKSIINKILKTIKGLNIKQSLKNRFKQTLEDLWIRTITKWQKQVINEAELFGMHQLDPRLDKSLPYTKKGMSKRIFPKPTEEQEKKTLSKCKGPCMIQPQSSVRDPSSGK